MIIQSSKLPQLLKVCHALAYFTTGTNERALDCQSYKFRFASVDVMSISVSCEPSPAWKVMPSVPAIEPFCTPETYEPLELSQSS